MQFFQARKDLDAARQHAFSFLHAHPDQAKIRTTRNLGTLWDEFKGALYFISREKEILFFAVLQWLIIMAGYWMFIQMLDWIPDELWREVRDTDDDSLGGMVNLALLAWAFLVIAVVSFPLGILNGMMVSTVIQERLYGHAFVPRAFKYALKSLGRIWTFTTLDAWITAETILDRLPKKNNRHNAGDELLYYAWKLGTAGVMPALVNGHGFLEAGKQSIALITKDPKRILGLRFGYSLLCWIVGILAYIGSVYWFCISRTNPNDVNEIYNFYALMIVPILMAVCVVSVLIRPLYLLCVTNIYLNNHIINAEHFKAADKISNSSVILTLVFLVALVVALLAVFMPDTIGIRDYIEQLAAQDLSHTTTSTRP